MYAVLGDDIVIADKSVATEYLKLMDWLGVDINLSKSIISRNRVAEFAKMYWTPADASPLPFREFLMIERSSSVLLEYARKFNLSLPNIFHVLGYGYKTKGALYTKKLSKFGPRVSRLLVSLTAPGSLFAKSLRDWILMDSLTKSSDQSNWDRITQHLIDTEFPRIVSKIESYRSKLADLMLAEESFLSEQSVANMKDTKLRDYLMKNYLSDGPNPPSDKDSPDSDIFVMPSVDPRFAKGTPLEPIKEFHKTVERVKGAKKKMTTYWALRSE